MLAFSGPGVQLQRARERYQALVSTGAHVAVIYAMKGKSCEAGSYNPDESKWGIESGPWFQIGHVAAAVDDARPKASAIHLAIKQQRSMLLDTARSQYRTLRPFRSLRLAWASDEPPEDALALGSFWCPNCGAHNDAGVETCHSCAASRPQYAGRGVLTLAVAPPRTRALAAGTFGFSPSE